MAAQPSARVESRRIARSAAARAFGRSYSERDWAGAEHAFRKANELNPSLANNHFHYSWYLALFGRMEEAFGEHRRARDLDPFTPPWTVYIPALHWFTGDYERALPEARENLELFPGVHRAYLVVGESAAMLELWDEAIAAYERMAELHPPRIGHLGHTYARAGLGRPLAGCAQGGRLGGRAGR